MNTCKSATVSRKSNFFQNEAPIIKVHKILQFTFLFKKNRKTHSFRLAKRNKLFVLFTPHLEMYTYGRYVILSNFYNENNNLTAIINEENRTANRSKYIIYPHEIKNLSRKHKFPIFTTVIICI